MLCSSGSCARTGSPLCGGCRTDLVRTLRRLPSLYDQCETMLVPRQRREVGRVRGGLPGSAPLNEDAVTARSTILGTLASWSGLVRDERPAPVPVRRDAARLAEFLLSHLEWLAAHPAAGDLREEVGEAAAQADRVLHADGEKRLELGKCDKHGCAGTVYATLQGGGGPSAGLVRCDDGHALRPHEWLLVHGAARNGRRHDAGRAA